MFSKEQFTTKSAGLSNMPWRLGQTWRLWMVGIQRGTWKLPAEGLTPQKTQLAWLERKVHHSSGMFRHRINWKQEISNCAYMIINEGCKHSTATHPKESAWDMAAEPTLRSMKHNLGPLLWAVTIQPSELVCVYILEHLELRLYGWAKVVTTCQND